jgi:hypothetical protein
MTYYPTSGTISASLSCYLFGHQVPLSTPELLKLYPDHGAYATAFIVEINKLVAEHWMTLPDAQAAIDSVADSSIPR